MTANALAVCVGPSLFRVTANNEGLLTQNKANEMAHKFIKNYSIFFKSNLDSNDNSSQVSSCLKIITCQKYNLAPLKGSYYMIKYFFMELSSLTRMVEQENTVAKLFW